jgi:hypothetical protein
MSPLGRKLLGASFLVVALIVGLLVKEWLEQPELPLEPQERASASGTATSQPPSATPANSDHGGSGSGSAPLVPNRDDVGAPNAPAPTSPVLHGTITAIDEHGETRPSLDGRFDLHFTRGGAAQQLEVPVKGGRWTTELTAVDALAVDGVILGEQLGRGAVEGLSFPPSGELSLRVELIPPSLLRVIDAATRASLSGIEVSYETRWLVGSNLYPERRDPNTPPLLANASSPIRLPPIDGQPVYWIHVEGYAWTSVQVQHQVGGEREVALVRGGTLDVELDRTPEVPLDLRITRDEAHWMEPIATQGRTLADFAPGPCEIRLRAGDQLLASTKTEVRAGETTRVDLVLPAMIPVAKKERARLRGTIVGAPSMIAELRFAWLIGETPPSVPGSDAHVKLAPDPKDPRSAPFDFGEVDVGRWVVTLDPIQLHKSLEVPAAGLENAVIELPPLCDVEIETVDGHTGEVLEDGGISWRTADHPFPERNTPVSVTPDKSRKVAHFLAPAVRILVDCWPNGYAYVQKELDVHQGRNRATISVEREQYVRVLLKDGDANVPIDPGRMEFDVVRADGSSAKVGWAKEMTTGALLVVVAEPGDFTLKSPPIAGFAALPDRSVHVEYGGTTDVVLQLGRD